MTSDQIKEEIVRKILQSTIAWATPEQQRQVERAAVLAMHDVEITQNETALASDFAHPNEWYANQFLAIKMVKGLSPKSLEYYSGTIRNLFAIVDKAVPEMTTNDIRYYLAMREQTGVSRVTLGNELRNLRSFFSTLHAEEMIGRNPTEKIDPIKTKKQIKKPFTELEMEKLRKACTNQRGLNKKHLAIVEVLYSTGCRVGELVGMNRDDVQGDRILVRGKGDKERWVYLNARAQVALNEYMNTRKDNLPAVFTGENIITHEQSQRITKSSVESIIRTLGKRAGVEGAHPHRFRRTAATIALRRGMPIEQVSKMLGHEQLETTKIYAITDEETVHASHIKYLT